MPGLDKGVWGVLEEALAREIHTEAGAANLVTEAILLAAFVFLVVHTMIERAVFGAARVLVHLVNMIGRAYAARHSDWFEWDPIRLGMQPAPHRTVGWKNFALFALILYLCPMTLALIEAT